MNNQEVDNSANECSSNAGGRPADEILWSEITALVGAVTQKEAGVLHALPVNCTLPDCNVAIQLARSRSR